MNHVLGVTFCPTMLSLEDLTVFDLNGRTPQKKYVYTQVSLEQSHECERFFKEA